MVSYSPAYTLSIRASLEVHANTPLLSCFGPLVLGRNRAQGMERRLVCRLDVAPPVVPGHRPIEPVCMDLGQSGFVDAYFRLRWASWSRCRNLSVDGVGEREGKGQGQRHEPARELACCYSVGRERL